MINGNVSRIYCRGSLGDCGVSAKNNCLFLEAVLWIVRAGAPWRDLPESFAHWRRVYVRYNRWSHKGVWNRVFAAVIDDPDLEYLMIDGSIVRVHQHGGQKKKNKPVKGRQVRQMRLLRDFRLTLSWHKGYDLDAFIEKVKAGGAVAVIPGHKNRVAGAQEQS